MNRSNLLTFLFPSHQRTHSNSPWAAHNRSLDLVPYMAPNGGFERHAFPAGKGLKTSEKSKVTLGDQIFHLFSRELASTTTCQLGKSKAQLEVALRCFETGNFWSPAELLFLRQPLFLRGLCSHQVLRSWSHSLFKWKLSLENSSLPGVWTNLWRGSETLFRVRSSTDSPRKWNDLLSIFLTSWLRWLLK